MKILRSGYYRVLKEWNDEIDDWEEDYNLEVVRDIADREYFGYGCKYKILSYNDYYDGYSNVTFKEGEFIYDYINKEDAIILDDLAMSEYEDEQRKSFSS